MRILFTLLFLPVLSWAQTQPFETVIQKGHELAVVAVAVSPDSNYVVTSSKDKSAKLWEINTGREVRSFLGHEKTVNCVTFTPDGKLLISGSNDQTIRIWDVLSGKMLSVIPTTDYIFAVAIDPI